MGSGVSRLPPDAAEKKVVIVGGGYSGVRLSRELRKRGASVTVISPTPFLFHNIGAPRAVALAGFIDQLIIPFPFEADGTKFVLGTAEKIDESGSVKFKDADGKEETIEGDIVVVATGSSYTGPFKVPPGTDEPKAKDLFGRASIAAGTSTSIVVVGGGPVGIETAGELKFAHPDVDVTLVHSGATLLSSGVNFPAGGTGELDPLRASLLRRLESLGVHVLLNHRVVREEGGEEIETLMNGVESGEREVRFEGEDHAPIRADLVIYATGVRPNSEAVAAGMPDSVDEKGYVKVDEHLHVAGKVWAMGDVAATGASKTVMQADATAKLMAANIAETLTASVSEREPRLESFEAMQPGMFVTVGPRDGAAKFPGGPNLGGFFVSSVKGGDLFAGKMRGDLGAPE